MWFHWFCFTTDPENCQPENIETVPPTETLQKTPPLSPQGYKCACHHYMEIKMNIFVKKQLYDAFLFQISLIRKTCLVLHSFFSLFRSGTLVKFLSFSSLLSLERLLLYLQCPCFVYKNLQLSHLQEKRGKQTWPKTRLEQNKNISSWVKFLSDFFQDFAQPTCDPMTQLHM